MSPKISLKDLPVFSTVENGPPGFEFSNAVGCFFCVKLRHSPVVHVLPAAHRVGEMHFPIVAVVDVAEGRRHPALGHYGMGFAEQRFADQTDANARRGRLDRGTQACTTSTDYEYVMFERCVFSHLLIIPESAEPGFVDPAPGV